MSIIAVDLDHTLCIPNAKGEHNDSFLVYGQAKPITQNIEMVNLHSAAHANTPRQT